MTQKENAKIWFITGISSGLGKALAEEVIAAGDFVIGSFRQQIQVDVFNNAYKNEALALRMDVTKPEDIVKAAALVEKQFGRIDVLVNNAGFGFAGAIEETNTEETRRVFEANFFGALAVTQHFLPIMRRQKSGQIFQISSHSGFKGFPGFGIYGASKFALEGFSEALALEVAPLGIKVTIVEPGPFRTEFAGAGFGFTEKIIDDYAATAGAFRERMKGLAGKQEGDPQKAAHAIINLAHSANALLRLPLGKIALITLASKLESVQKDLDAAREVAAGAVYQ